MTLPNDLPAPYNTYRSYFPASYVKFVESGGARAAPIPYYATQQQLDALLPYLNGFLFTGGAASFSQGGTPTQFAQTAYAMYQTMEKAAAQGETVPLHGTCLGHELTFFLASGLDPTVLTNGFDAENISLPLDFTPAAAGSRLWGSAPGEVTDAFAAWPISLNAHQAGITPDTYAGNPKLQSVLRVLSTNVDREGRPFISSSEGITLPITTTQFHPEKPVFEWWASENINHTYTSVVANSWLQRYFVNEARANSRGFPTPDAEAAALIYNYSPVYTGNVSGFEQVYLFN